MTNVTVATESRYTDGSKCWVARNDAYPGIVGQGKDDKDAIASFEAARRAYEEMTQVPREAPATLTWFRPVTDSGYRPSHLVLT